MRSWPQNILMANPEHFTVQYSINPFMARFQGQPVDKAKAFQQWNRLRETFISFGKNVLVAAGRPDLPDFCFCANQAFPYWDAGRRMLLAGRMAHAERAPEVPLILGVLGPHADGVVEAPMFRFEASGDALWNYETEEIFMGFGPRTSFDAAPLLRRLAKSTVHALELAHPTFYHLDTCLSILSGGACLYVEEAFSEEGLSLIRRKFPRALKVPGDEALNSIAANAVPLDEKNVLLQEGAAQTAALLEGQGFVVTFVNCGEFLKAGGGLFCLKQYLWD